MKRSLAQALRAEFKAVHQALDTDVPYAVTPQVLLMRAFVCVCVCVCAWFLHRYVVGLLPPGVSGQRDVTMRPSPLLISNVCVCEQEIGRRRLKNVCLSYLCTSKVRVSRHLRP